jgi:hypothetical protein
MVKSCVDLPRSLQVNLTEAGTVYDLGPRGSLKILGLADTGRPQDAYDDCYQEDYDNYLDVIVDASSEEAAAALARLEAFQEGYSPLYNPGECERYSC